MATEIKLPDLGEGIESGDVVSVLVEPGQTIEPEQSILELETDKATVEVPADQGGTVAEIRVSAGDSVSPGDVLMTLEDQGGQDEDEDKDKDEQKPETDASEAESEPAGKEESPRSEQPAQAPQSGTGTGDRSGAGPAVVRMPEVGEGVESGQVVSVLVEVGDQIDAEQSIAEIETDKATVEVPSDQAGTVRQIHIAPGDTLDVGAEMITLDVQAAEGQAGKEPDADEKKSSRARQGAAEDQRGEQSVNEPDVQEKARQAEGEVPSSGRDGLTDAQARAAGPQDRPTGAFAYAQAGDQPVSPPEQPVQAPVHRDRPVIPAGPATRRYARELGVDLHLVEGSGPGGRIQKEDVRNAVRQMSQAMHQAPGRQAPAEGQTPPPDQKQPQPAPPGEADRWGQVRREKMPKIRQTIARRMHESASTIPHVTNFDDADVTDLEAFRQAHKNDFETKLTMMPFVIKAVANALAAHPVINASLDLDAGEVLYKQYVSIGIAVDTDRGLIVPVLRNADALSIAQIATKINELAQAARSGDFDLGDLRGGSFTISNLGAIGGRYSTPIINAPEVAILLLGRSRLEPRALDQSRIEARMVMPLSLSYDHRLVDGADAARFLESVKGYLESPGKLLLTI